MKTGSPSYSEAKKIKPTKTHASGCFLDWLRGPLCDYSFSSLKPTQYLQCRLQKMCTMQTALDRSRWKQRSTRSSYICSIGLLRKEHRPCKERCVRSSFLEEVTQNLTKVKLHHLFFFQSVFNHRSAFVIAFQRLKIRCVKQIKALVAVLYSVGLALHCLQPIYSGCTYTIA